MKKLLLVLAGVASSFVAFSQPLNGTYTINNAGGGNYLSYTAAVAALVTNGVSGPVTFNVAVASGPYTEQVNIPQITGASAVNRITFNGNGTTMQFASTNSALTAVIWLNGADYFTFNNINILPNYNGTAIYGFGVWFYNTANFNVISGCTVTFPANTTSGTMWGITMTAASTGGTFYNGIGFYNNNTVINNTITNAYGAISVMGNGLLTECMNNQIIGNTIVDHYIYGMFIYNNINSLISGNSISRLNRTSVTTFYGIYFAGSQTPASQNCIIEKNRMFKPMGNLVSYFSTSYFIFNLNDGSAAGRNVFRNNAFYDFNGTTSHTGATYCFYNSNADYNDYWHNTIDVWSPATPNIFSTRYGFYILSNFIAGGVTVQNNCLSWRSNGLTTARMPYYYSGNTAGFVTTNRNNIWAPGGYFGYYSNTGTYYTTLAAWQAGTGYDLQSTNVDPLYWSPGTGDFTPTNAAMSNIGAPLGVTTDIVGNTRNLVTPDAGAWEFSTFPDVGVFTILQPSSSCTPSATATVQVAVKNFTTTPTTPTSITFSVAGPIVSGPITEAWTGGPIPAFGTTNQTFVGTANLSVIGTYTVTAFTTLAGDTDPSNNTKTKVVQINPPVVANAGPDVTVCPGAPKAIGGSPTGTGGNGVYTYSWSPATGLSSPTVSNPMAGPAAPTIYTVTVTDANGCTGNDAVLVSVAPAPVADAGPDYEYCENSGTVVTLGGSPSGSSGTPPYTYSWGPNQNISSTTAPNPTANPNVTTTYTLTVTDFNACAVSDAATVTVHELPDVTIKITQGADSICYGDTITLEATTAGSFGNEVILLTTTTGTNGQNGVMFDLQAKPIDDVNILALDGVALNPGTTTFEIYYKTGTHVGFETNAGAWTFVGSAPGVVMPPPPTIFAVPIPINVIIPAGQRAAFYFTSVAGQNIRYSNGTGVGNIFVQDPNLIHYEGVGKSYPFGATFQPRVYNGRIHYNIPTAPPNNQYLWSTGDTTGTITFIPTATNDYWVEVTDSNGCVGYDTINVWVNQEIVLVAPDVSICLGDTVILGGTPTASGGSGMFQYQWNPLYNLSCTTCPNPAANPAFTTQYYLEVIDSFLCVVNEQTLVTVNLNPEADAGPPQAICPGDVVMIGGSPTGFNGTPPYTYGWLPAAGLNDPTLSNPDASPAVTTMYTVTVSDANGCFAIDSMRVTVYPEPDASILTTGPYCENAGVQTLQAATPGGTWSGTGIINPATGDFDPAVAGPGVHNITYNVTNAVGCSDSDTEPITVYALTPVNITSGIDYCETQGPVTLTGTPAGGTWSGNGITNPATGTFDPALAGLGTHAITYTYTDGNGCTNSDVAMITVHPSPDATINPAGPFCQNAGVQQLTAATPGGTWSGLGTSPTGQFNPAAAGVGVHTVFYTITDANGCSDNDTEQITVLSSPTAVINPSSPHCVNGSIVTLVAAPATGTNYWSGPGIISPLTGQFSPSSAGPGTHTITLVKTYANGCQSTATTVIVVYALPDATINPVGPQCADGGTIQLTAATGGGTWSGPGTSSSGVFNPVTAGVGTHTITYIVTNANGCTNSDDIQITVTPAVVVTGAVTHISCDAATDGSIDITVTGGTPPFAINWSSGQTTEDIHKVPAGSYTVTVTDNIGCSETANFTINGPTPITITPIVTLPATTPSYDNGEIDITPSGGTPPYTFIWSNGATTEDVDGLQSDTYHVTIVDAHGCRYTFDITVDATFGTGITAQDIISGMKLYPNPTDGVLNFELDLGVTADIQMRMVDVLGRAVYVDQDHMVNTYTNTIDMSAWASGTYILMIQVGEQVVQTKVVLTK